MLNNKEDARLKPSVHYCTSHLDFQEGDIVQVTRGNKNVGRIGRIIAIQYSKVKDRLYYIVQFSNKESEKMLSYFIQFVSREDEVKVDTFLSDHPECSWNCDQKE